MSTMHDPSVLVAHIRFIDLDVWHDEPGGRDAGEICGYPPHGATLLVWTLRHVRHLHYRFWPYLKIKRWIVDRCDHCGQRFRWHEARHSYQHDVCMSLRHVRGQLDDITNYLRGEADDNARWRVEYRLKNLDATKACEP